MLFRKLPVAIRIEPVTEERTIQTLEGSQTIRPGQFLATGVKGEQYAMPANVFAEYQPVEGRDGFFSKNADVNAPPVIVDAIQVDFDCEIFRPDWQHRNTAGGYLVTKGVGSNDQYFVAQDVFETTYVAVEGQTTAESVVADWQAERDEEKYSERASGGAF